MLIFTWLLGGWFVLRLGCGLGDFFVFLNVVVFRFVDSTWIRFGARFLWLACCFDVCLLVIRLF